MKKRGMGPFIALGGIALVLIIASIIFVVSSSYTAKLVLVNDGFFVGDMVHDCLYETDESNVVSSIPAIGASQSDILYEKSGKYYVGNDYTPVSLNFPYVINNASAVMFTSSVDKLITGTFEYVDSYENLYMSGGVTFNADMERAYREDFILVDAGNGVYMNADKLTVGGALTTAAEIPANSFIRFLENEIGYYYYEGDALLYAKISPVSRTANISLGGFNYTYIEFLEKLGLYSERKAKDKVSPTPSPAPENDDEEDTESEPRKEYNFADPNYVPGDNENAEKQEGITKVSTSTGESHTNDSSDTEFADEGERDDEGERESITPDPGERPTRPPRPTKEPDIPEPAGDPLPAEDTGERVTPTPRPTATPLPTPTLMPILETSADGTDPAVPAPAAPAAPAAAAPAKEKPQQIPKEYKDKKDRPVYFDEWKKPEVHLGDITTGTYTIFLDNFHIENAQFLYKRYGVQFYVNEGTTENDKLVYTKSVTGGGALRLAQPFKPNTKYTIRVVLNYINAYGETMVEEVLKFGDIVVETKGRDSLDSLDLTYTKGTKASNSFKLNDVGIGIAVNNPTGRFIEATEYLSRLEFEVTNAGDANDVRVVTLSNTELSKLRKGELFDFESTRVFRSNSTYNYVIRAYDRSGAQLFMLDQNGVKKAELSGSFKTCTEMPRASFRVQSNKIYDYTVAMRIANSGNAAIKNVRYHILDKDGNVVTTTTQYVTTVSGGGIDYSPEEQLGVHSFTDAHLNGLYDPSAGSAGVDPNRLVEIVTKFSDLSDQCLYVLQVLADCDVYSYDEEDYPGGIVPEEDKWLIDQVIGETKFTTANISSLGNLFLSNDIPATEENLAEGRLYMNLRLDDRSNELLIDLLDEISIGLYKNEKDSNGKETGNYVLDEDAKISYVICDATDDTQYMDIDSVVAGTRPADLEDWEAQATLAGQNEYDRTLAANYNGNLSDAQSAFVEIGVDTDGNDAYFDYDYFYNKAYEAQNRLNTGEVATESEEYTELQAIINKFESVRAQVEAEAMNKTRDDAEAARKTAYDAKYLSLSGGNTETGYITGLIRLDEDTITELKKLYTPSATATGSAVYLKYQKELRIAVTGLATNTQYELRANALATVGTSGSASAVRTILTRNSFRTYKKRAIVAMDAYYASSNFISLFGVRMDDPDGSISEYPVELTVTNRTGGVMGVRTITGPDDLFDEMRFNNLAMEEVYTLTFLAKEYNKGWSKGSSEINKEIYVNELTETLKIITHESIKAEIELKGINDAYDLAPEVRVYVSKNTNASSGPIIGRGASSLNGTFSYSLGKNKLSDGNYYIAGGGQSYYVYKARYQVDAELGDELYNIIEPGVYPTRNRFTRYQVFEDEACTKPISDITDPACEVKITAKDASTNAALSRNYWTSNYIRLNKSLTGKVRIWIVATAINLDSPLGGKSLANSGVYMFTGVSFHKFGDRAYTANINAVLKDDYGQLGSNGVSKYYVKVYEKEGEATQTNGGYRLISERLHEWRELASNEEREHESDNCMLNMYEYDKYADGGRGPGLGEKTFVGGAKQIDTNFGVRVNAGKYYRLELWIKINNYSIRVGTVNFTSDRIIHSIDCEDDLLDAYCHPADSYIVTTDIRTTRANIFNTKQFDGVIDFNGHTLTHMTNEYLIHTLGAYGEIRNIVFQKGDGLNNYKNLRGIIYDNYGHVDNVVVNYKNKIETIDNENRNSSNFRESQYVQGLIVTNNYPTGVVENFCIDVQEDIHFYAGDGVGLALYNNYGMLRNGYSCSTTGAKIHQVALLSEFQQLFTNTTTAKTQYTSNYYTGGIARRNINGIIEGVFGLVDMELRKNDDVGNPPAPTIYRKGAAVCGLNEGYVRNSFSAAQVLTMNKAEDAYEAKNGFSPANLNFVEGNNVYGHSSNIFHYGCGLEYGTCKEYKGFKIDSVEIRKELLYDHNWYESLFDSDDITRPGQWDYDFISRGCYPHVVMSECMENAQPQIPLPALTQTTSEITPLAAIVTEQNEAEAYATVTFYNPNGFIINNVMVDYMSVRVIQQWEEGKFYYARIRMTNPIKYYSSYNLTGFRYSTRSSSGSTEVNLREENYVPISAEFFKMIRSVGDFMTISSGLDENYRLGNDINFFGYNIQEYAVGKRQNGKLGTDYANDNNTGCFTGQFDGSTYNPDTKQMEIHTLRNIDVGDTGYLFAKVAGPIRNLNVENIHTTDLSVYGAHKSTAKYMGLVAVFREGASLDNVHVYGAKFENITQFCGVLLARNYFENEITNCSVHNAVLSTGTPADNSTAASVGGFVGHNDLGVIIHNSYIDNFAISAAQAGDVYGVGGMVGYTVNGIELENVYAVRGRIDTNYTNVGGLIGSVQSMNDVSTSSKSSYYTEEYFIRNYYTDVEIITLANNVGGVIGYTSKLAGWDWGYGVNFGRIVTKSTLVESKTIGPVVGFYTGSSNDTKKGLRLGKHQYVYEGYELDGDPFVEHDKEETETSRLAYFKILTYSDLTKESTYGWEGALNRPKLAWRGSFEIDASELAKGNMPKLYYSYEDESGHKKLLPGQEDFSLKPSDLEIESVEVRGDSGMLNDIPTLTVVLRHDDSVKVTGFDFDGTEWTEAPNPVILTESDGTVVGTRFNGTLKLKGDDGWGFAKDKFFITAVNYKKSTVATMSAIEAEAAGKAETKKKERYINLDIQSRWLYIDSVEQWNQIMTQAKYGGLGYNIYVTEDLDFSGFSINGIAHNVKINHLIGRRGGQGTSVEDANHNYVYNSAATVTIKGIRLYEDDTDGNAACFIEQATGMIAGINFEDCTISQTYNAAVTKAKVSNKTALIGMVNGMIQHVALRRINILAYASANIAPIGLIYNISSDITLEDINVIQHQRGDGKGYVSTYSNRGGYTAFMGKFAGIDGLTANRIYVDAAGASMGGIAGTQVGGTYFWNINVNDVVAYNRADSSFVGGIIGNAKDRGTYQRCGMLHVDNVFVRGHSYVGGIAGRAYIGGWNSDGYRRTTGSGIDGNVAYYVKDKGTTADSVRSWVKRGLVVSYAGESVGGAVGLGGAWKITVEDSTVLGGTYTGGVIGRYAAIDCIARNVYVSRWQEKVGGDTLTQYEDCWPSMFYRPGASYKDLRDENISGRYQSNQAGTLKKIVGQTGSGITSHDDEQLQGQGQYFVWKRLVTTNVASDNARKTFWDEAVWGITSYKINFGAEERQHGRPGKTFTAFGQKLVDSGVSANVADGNLIKKLNSYRQISFGYNEPTYNVKVGTRYDYIGGVVGYATGARGLLAENVTVYAPRSFYVGGIAGRGSAYDGNYTAFGGNYSMIVKNCKVIGGELVGGAIGDFWRYNSQAIFVDDKTLVEARKFDFGNNDQRAKGIKVGGVFGRVYMGSSSAGEHPQAKYIVSGATVVGKNMVGGIIGSRETDFYTEESDVGWLMLGNVIVNSTNSGDLGNGGMLFHRTSGLGFVNIAGVKEDSTVKVISDPVDNTTNLLKTGQTVISTQTAQNYIDTLSSQGYSNRVKPVTVNELKKKATYVSAFKWPDSDSMTSSNYTTYRFKYDKVTEGYLPSLTMGGSIQNSWEQGGKKDMFPFERILMNIPGVTVNSNSGSNTTGGGIVDFSGMPEATIYNSGVDTISVDFSRIDPAYTWTISIGGQVHSGQIDQKTISFTYDFVSDVTLVVSGAEGEQVFTSSGADLARYVGAAGGAYYYITSDGVARGTGSNLLPTKYGQYVNIFGGKALERDGSIIDLETGAVTTQSERGTVLAQERTPEPLYEGMFGNYVIKTYLTYSVTTDVTTGENTVREGFLFFTDGKTLQSIRTGEKMRSDSVILWSDLEKTYFAALGSDRKLTVLLDGAFKVPEDISTEGICEMSSSRDIRAPYCIVRYANGGLCAFNFVTGEILFEQAAARGLAVGGGDASSGSRAVSFNRAMELTDALKSGAVDLNGIVRTSPVSAEDGSITEVIEGDPVDGKFVSTGEPTGEVTDGLRADGSGSVNGEESVDGTVGLNDEDNAEATGAGSREGEDGSLEEGEQPAESGSGSDAEEGVSGKALINDETAASKETEGDLPVPGEVSENHGTNTINGTNNTNGENNTDGEVSEAQSGNANGSVGSEITQTAQNAVDLALLASVESQTEALIEDGSIAIDNIVEALGITEAEAEQKLCDKAAQIADSTEGISIIESIALAYRDIILNPDSYIDEPEVAVAVHTDYSQDAQYLRDLEIIKNAVSGSKIDPEKLSLVPVYNPETGEYELFEAEELLKGEETSPKSIEERLAENGRFINVSHGLKTGADAAEPTHDYRGLIAVLIAVLLAGGLTWAMIYKKRKEGSR